MIAVDWGTSNLRAWRLDATGSVVDSAERPSGGILNVPAGGFPTALRELVGGWIAAGESLVLLCGMVGSRQGWVEAPYLSCPAGPAELAGALTALPFPEARTLIVPGLTARDANGVPEVMRGEETKLLGLMPELGGRDATVCMPGTHCKWAGMEGGRVTGFATHMTGEVFAVLSGHSILGRTIDVGAAPDWDAFDRGLARARQGGGLLHHLFGVRALHLIEDMAPAAGASYLSGLLIGHEVAAVGGDGPVQLVGTGGLVARYARALGDRAVPHDGAALVIAGLHAIGRQVEGRA
ncbi:2-dehydro-3-deoxygalactonokinase [Muricoccus radiodurans]|uniref:2-dehydro-3-deoxygalactonokinase n=1 Tax=Muricoccus radiodurans TaxID=2231721 RepID=UPI003CF30E19